MPCNGLVSLGCRLGGGRCGNLQEASNLRPNTFIQPANPKLVAKKRQRETTHDKFFCKWEASAGRRRPVDSVAVGLARFIGSDRYKVWLRDGAARSVHSAPRREGDSILRSTAIARGRQTRDHH